MIFLDWKRHRWQRLTSTRVVRNYHLDIESEAIEMVDAMDVFEAENAGQDAAARADLERIEQEVVAEAEASVEDFDALGQEQDAAFAAETAFEFDEAQKAL